jgi:uncharacterized repeat protein (TIGR03803 family)
MKTQLKILHNASRTCEMTGPVSGRQPVMALLMRLLWAAALVLPAFGAQSAVVLTSLYSFTGTNDCANPQAGLVQGSDGNLYGTTCWGGTNGGWGTVFKISTNGALTTLYAFGTVTDADGNPLDGVEPCAGLVQGSDGSFYGTTEYGGTNSFGTVFRISTNGVLTTLYSFSGDDGANPDAGLVQGSDGYFYGTTEDGGPNGGYGTVFKISTSGALTTLYAFGTVTNTNGDPVDGGIPRAGLVQGSDGYFYGTTSRFGTNGLDNGGNGTVFKVSTNGALTTLYSFTGDSDDAHPYAALVQGREGNYYGATCVLGYLNGASIGDGTVFKISTNGALTSLYSFTGTQDGAWPYAGLVQGTDGNFYGTTCYGGTNDNGTVFRLTVVPMPPQLTIIPSGANVILTWPTNAVGFTLQSTTNLGASAVWATNSPGPVVVNGQNTVTNPITGTQKFYRLSQ